MNISEALEIKIAEARSFLSKETKEAIDGVDWKIIISGMNTKYNQDQLEHLEIETDLLLCGILTPEEYQKGLERRMVLLKSEVVKLLEEMDKLIFKKIQEKLVILLNSKKEKDEKNLDQKQENSSRIDYQQRIYNLGKKYNLLIDQMGLLEEVINKEIDGQIGFENFEQELKSKIKLPVEKEKDLINDINNLIFKEIRASLKAEKKQSSFKEKENEEIPTPPYSKTKKTEKDDVVPIPDYSFLNKEEKENFEIEIMNEPYQNSKEKFSNQELKDDNLTPEDMGIDIIEEKLSSPTVQKTTTTDNSLPKISSSKEEN
jgi:cell fate (sporulation/competence/biofilm development) regulator YlbF (YheA/YmcA/DUF963 family)